MESITMDHLPKTILNKSFVIDRKTNASALQAFYQSIIKAEPWREFCKPEFKVQSTNVYVWLDKEKHFVINIYSGLNYNMSLIYQPCTLESQKYDVHCFKHATQIVLIQEAINDLIYTLIHKGYEAVAERAMDLKFKGESDQ